jgi:DNA-binding NarL/FixJ family response regulator
LVQQSGGESLFRSEAAAWLAITLAENGEVEEAAEVLDRLPPDRIALVPGLEPWARGALAQAVGDPETALAQLRRATDVARAAGSKLVELGYLLSTMELTGRVTDGDADRLAELAAHVDAPRLVAVAAGVLALAGRRDDPLEVADQLEASGVYRRALAVAQLAQTSAQGVRARAEVDGRVARLRVRLGLADPQARPSGLTAREWELAELAARGLTDRQIAERLVLSVRTVQTHLARAYRKLQVGSRRELATALTAAMTAAEA